MHHPLFDALTADEIARTTKAVRDDGAVGVRPAFAAVFTEEPDKALLRAGEDVPRRARAMVLDKDTGASWDVVVDLTTDAVVETHLRTAGTVAMLGSEVELMTELVKADARYVAALAERGITDLSTVQIDPWGLGNREEYGVEGRRLIGGTSFLRHFPEDNGYAHPIEGVVAIVDVTQGEVLDVLDHGVRPLNEQDMLWTAEANGPMRTDVAPLEIHQPQGVGFTVDGTVLHWQKWRFRIGMHPLEGLVLHGVEYRDGDRWRSVAHRLSLSEMVVPYGDPSPEHWWRSAFDAGEYGMGNMANSLRLGCDCKGEIVYLDAVLSDEDGEPRTIDQAICIHEEDAGILWKHTDWVTGAVDVRRSRRLVVSAISTVGNYHYGFYWNFYQDASIEVEIKLLGIVQPRAVADGEVTPHASPVGPNLVATYHQHLFGFRLDMEVDGWQNTVVQNDAHPVPVGEANPHGNAIGVTRTVIEREHDGDGLTDPHRSRSWTVTNQHVRNAWGSAVGYKLLPGWASATILADPSATVARRAGFAAKNIWVTPYRPDELRAAGEAPHQDRAGSGLPAWTAGNRAVADTDVVLWHTVGVTHVPRAEDWPVMPMEKAGFHLLPVNFFDRNPAMDVPADPVRGHGTPGTDGCCSGH
ncbi:primary-amine oxidase [Klenkia marina]|uniref:Amine oxidase n=1 Tax=Klenkia marina TaxID=1960309 RepID=A0A1G4YLX9_9ACTN|nr:primary-amine oxidase [Klenkia marina]SCX54497.1 primary-amine oxidase [Klenkia marina]